MALSQKPLLGTGVVVALEAFVLVVGDLLRHVRIAIDRRSPSSSKRLHLAARPRVTGVQRSGKNPVT
jgi:hypothetical protein